MDVVVGWSLLLALAAVLLFGARHHWQYARQILKEGEWNRMETRRMTESEAKWAGRLILAVAVLEATAATAIFLAFALGR